VFRLRLVGDGRAAELTSRSTVLDTPRGRSLA
jgi:hypothetical protein